jgi:hypothetical protein
VVARSDARPSTATDCWQGLGVLERALLLEVRGDAGRTEGVVADPGSRCRRPRVVVIPSRAELHRQD